MPSSANMSILGVIISGFPYVPAAHCRKNSVEPKFNEQLCQTTCPISSANMNKMFGRSAAEPSPKQIAKTTPNRNITKTRRRSRTLTVHVRPKSDLLLDTEWYSTRARSRRSYANRFCLSPQSFFGLGASAEVEVTLSDYEKRKKVEIRNEDGKKEKLFLFYDGETVAGKASDAKRNEYESIHVTSFHFLDLRSPERKESRTSGHSSRIRGTNWYDFLIIQLINSFRKFNF